MPRSAKPSICPLFSLLVSSSCHCSLLGFVCLLFPPTLVFCCVVPWIQRDNSGFQQKYLLSEKNFLLQFWVIFCPSKPIQNYMEKTPCAHAWFPCNYRKVVSSRPVYYSILELFGQRLQYISLLKILGSATNQDSLLLPTLRYIFLTFFLLRIAIKEQNFKVGKVCPF